MVKLLDETVTLEKDTSKNGWYMFDANDMNRLFKLDIISKGDIFRMARVMVNKAGEYDDQLRHFTTLEIRKGCRYEIQVTGISTPEEDDEDCFAVAVGEVEYMIKPIVKKSKLIDIDINLFFGLENGYVEVHELPGLAVLYFLQYFAKFLLGEVEPMEWVDPCYD